MKLDKINYTYEIGKEEILDQMLYSYTEAYGLDGADEIEIYLPGAPIDQLPEEFLQWACSNYDRLEAEENGLPCYGLYNCLLYTSCAMRVARRKVSRSPRWQSLRMRRSICSA